MVCVDLGFNLLEKKTQNDGPCFPPRDIWIVTTKTHPLTMDEKDASLQIHPELIPRDSYDVFSFHGKSGFLAFLGV